LFWIIGSKKWHKCASKKQKDELGLVWRFLQDFVRPLKCHLDVFSRSVNSNWHQIKTEQYNTENTEGAIFYESWRLHSSSICILMASDSTSIQSSDSSSYSCESLALHNVDPFLVKLYPSMDKTIQSYEANKSFSH